MKLVYASNDNYARHLAVSMTSVFAGNQKEKEITVYILSMGLSGFSIRSLLEIGEAWDRKVVILPVRSLQSIFGYRVQTGGFDISAMARLFMGTLLPADVDRVLYLDCDTVVTGSLRELWETDLQGKIIGAVMEPTIYREAKEEIGLGEEDPYYNSGVLLVDLKKWRENLTEWKFIEFYAKKNGRLIACDQDTINAVLKGQIHTLMPRYNFFTNYRYFPYRELTFLSETYRTVPEADFTFAKKHPSIIHYMGDERPWIRGNLNHYHKPYDIFLNMTPWEGWPKEGGRELYMLAYHLMDWITWLCPPVRRMISKGFGIKVLESRRK